MNIVFVSPHPDDIELFCGGTLLHHYNAGDSILVVNMTRGGSGTINSSMKGSRLEEIRTKEALCRYSILENVRLLWMELEDGNVAAGQREISSFAGIIKDFTPDIIYAPEHVKKLTMYPHPDHIAVGRIVDGAVSVSGCSAKVMSYHSSGHNFYVDVDGFQPEIKSALKHYKSQYSITAFPPFLLHMFFFIYQRYKKKWGRKASCKYAEAFREN